MTQKHQRYVLFPGRHHLFTSFQWAELQRIVAGDAADLDGEPQPDPKAIVVVAITSANHSNTRRNPVPVELRAAQAHLAAAQAAMRCLTVPVSDVGHSTRFAEHIVAAVAAEETVCDRFGVPVHLTPKNCVVACSTPEVARQFAGLGYAVFAMEHAGSPLDGALIGDDMWTETRPWQIVEAIAAADGVTAIAEFLEAHPASQRVWEQHRLGLRVNALFSDPIVGDDSDLTTGRDYQTYMASFDRGAERKWDLLEPYVEPGRLVDIGCATGAMLALAGETPKLAESDMIGIELSRALYDECVHRRRMGAFPNENTFFYHRNATEQLFAPLSVNTTITVSLTHEIVSYLDEAALEALSCSVFDHTAPGGVWLIYDVCGPAEPDRIVRMQLDDEAGVDARTAARVDHRDLSVSELGPWLDTISVRARFHVFAETFRAEQGESPSQVGSVTSNADGSVDLRFADAMDFLAHHTYTESWRSEMNERFCYRNLASWQERLTAIGFDVEPASRTWTNPWLAEHRFSPVAKLTEPSTGETLDWGATNLVVVARRN